jgi:hypothetical protein
MPDESEDAYLSVGPPASYAAGIKAVRVSMTRIRPIHQGR